MHGSANNVRTFEALHLRNIPPWIAHPSDPRSRLTARMRIWATTARWVCACDAQCCREKRHVHGVPGNPTLADPNVTAWWPLLSITAMCGVHYRNSVFLREHVGALRFSDVPTCFSILTHRNGDGRTAARGVCGSTSQSTWREAFGPGKADSWMWTWSSNR